MTITPLHRVPEHVSRDDTPRVEEQVNPFLRDLAHELRSPLCSFSLALASLTDDHTILDLRDQETMIDAMRQSAAHMQSIVDSLADVADVSARSFTVRPIATDLVVVLHDAINIVAPMLRSSDQQLDIDLPSDTLTVLADPPRLRQVMVNLLHNAIKYSPPGETIMVRARAETMATIEVIDHGPAIPPDQRARLFERLFRGHSTAIPGNGLGLTIAKTIVAAHGGSIGVRCAAERGNTFWLTLHLV